METVVGMAKTLGKIEKPPVSHFEKKRKLYCVPLLYSIKNAPKEYLEKLDLYWNQATEHINNLEKAGKVSKIYYESISSSNEDALKEIKQIDERSYKLVKVKFDQGAEIISLEDKEVFNEYMDWSICLSVISRSKNVFAKVLEFYEEAHKKRIEHITKRINETLNDGEAGLLIMNDDDRSRIQFSSDIEVFLVRPPALNEILRWLRDYLSKSKIKNTEMQ